MMGRLGNQFKAFLLMGLLTVLLVQVGQALGGRSGALLFFLLSLAMNFFGYWFSDRVAILMSGARPVSEAEAPGLYALTRRLCQRANLPMPRLYVIPSMQPNAFATGRSPSHSAVAVTEGILQLLDEEELAGVLAHELAHIKNRDILIGTLAAAGAGAINMLADAARWALWFGGGQRDEEGEGGHPLATLVALVVAPIAALLIQMAISRSREFLADETGAEIAGSAWGLRNALLKLERGVALFPQHVNPATAHMYIVNPLRGDALFKLFSTHPPIPERVRRLEEWQARHRNAQVVF